MQSDNKLVPVMRNGDATNPLMAEASEIKWEAHTHEEYLGKDQNKGMI